MQHINRWSVNVIHEEDRSLYIIWERERAAQYMNYTKIENLMIQAQKKENTIYKKNKSLYIV